MSPTRLPTHFVSNIKLQVNFQEDTCKIHQNLAVSKYFDGSGRNPPEFLNKNGNTNVPMNPNEGIRFNATQESWQRNNTKLRIWIEPKKVEAVTCSIKTDPKIDFCEARKKRTLATIVDDDGFPRYNYQEGRTDTKDSLNHFKGLMLMTFLSGICHQRLFCLQNLLPKSILPI